MLAKINVPTEPRDQKKAALRPTYCPKERRGGLMVSTQVRQSEGSRFKSCSGQIAYFHGIKTRLSTLGTGDVPHGSDST